VRRAEQTHPLEPRSRIRYSPGVDETAMPRYSLSAFDKGANKRDAKSDLHQFKGKQPFGSQSFSTTAQS
jgi:hypothetical protein